MDLYKQPKKEIEFLHVITKWICDIIIVVFITLFIWNGFFTAVVMGGHSMSEPGKDGVGIANGDSVLLDKVSYKLSKVKRYDVICFNYQEDGKDIPIIKRVIGLPGETVCIKDGHIYIDGKVLEKDVVKDIIYSAGIASEEIKLSSNEYFVLGDNRNNSEDSRNQKIGTVTKNQIVGKVWLISEPVEHIGFISSR
ncbi:MAG: signal peptidase I [Lachnospiraceae bacterium]|nr:signal peptidase I [Lachnospiraceae bacterium]